MPRAFSGISSTLAPLSPSTMLRMVPLPIACGDGEDRVVRPSLFPRQRGWGGDRAQRGPIPISPPCPGSAEMGRGTARGAVGFAAVEQRRGVPTISGPARI